METGKTETPKFSQVWNDIQAKMGEKPKEQRQAKKSLDKDDFLKIMINQMKFQDPTKPFDADKMMAEMASITSVEQLQNINQTLKKMDSANRPAERMGMTHLIGKYVTVDRNRFPHTEGQPSSIAFQLGKDAVECSVTIVDQSGEVVAERNLGIQSGGTVSFVWDGVKANNTPAKSGDYMIRVNAKTAQGQPVPMQSQMKSQVIGVSFEGSDAVLLVGDSKQQQKVRMDQIIKIETEGQQQAPASQDSLNAIPLPEKVLEKVKQAATPQATQDPERAKMAQKVAEIAGKPNFMPIADGMKRPQTGSTAMNTAPGASRGVEVRSGELDKKGGRE